MSSFIHIRRNYNHLNSGSWQKQYYHKIINTLLMSTCLVTQANVSRLILRTMKNITQRVLLWLVDKLPSGCPSSISMACSCSDRSTEDFEEIN